MTPAGEKVYRQAKATLNDWQSLVQELRCEAPSNLHGSLTLKTMELFNKALLPQMGIYFLKMCIRDRSTAVPLSCTGKSGSVTETLGLAAQAAAGAVKRNMRIKKP